MGWDELSRWDIGHCTMAKRSNASKEVKWKNLTTPTATWCSYALIVSLTLTQNFQVGTSRRVPFV